MPNLPAARRGDETGHSAFHGGGGGGRSGALHGLLAGDRLRGPARAVLVAAALAEGNGGVRLEHLARALGGPRSGSVAMSTERALKKGEGDQDDPVHTGSPDVLIGGTDKRAARAGVDVAKCPEHRHRELKAGSVTVLINGRPASRASERLKCSGGHVLAGCETVLIGGASGDDGASDEPAASGAEVGVLAGAALANRALETAAARILGLDGGDGVNAPDGGARGADGATAGAAIAVGGAAGGSAIGAALR